MFPPVRSTAYQLDFPTLSWLVDAPPDQACPSRSAGSLDSSIRQAIERLVQATNARQLLARLVQEMVAGALPPMLPVVLCKLLQEAGLDWAQPGLVKTAQTVFRSKASPMLQEWVSQYGRTFLAGRACREQLSSFLRVCPFRAVQPSEMLHAMALIDIGAYPSSIHRAGRRHADLDAAPGEPPARRRRLDTEASQDAAAAATSGRVSVIAAGPDVRQAGARNSTGMWEALRSRADVRVRAWLREHGRLLGRAPDLRWALASQLRQCGTGGLTGLQLARILIELGHPVTKDFATRTIAIARMQLPENVVQWFDARKDLLHKPGNLQDHLVAEFVAEPLVPRLTASQLTVALHLIGIERSLANADVIISRIDAHLGNPLTAWLSQRKDHLQSSGNLPQALRAELMEARLGYLSVRGLTSALTAIGLAAPAPVVLGRIIAEARMQQSQRTRADALAADDAGVAWLDNWVGAERAGLANFTASRWDLALSLRSLLRTRADLQLTAAALEAAAARQSLLLPPSASNELLRLAEADESQTWKRWVQRHADTLQTESGRSPAVLQALLEDCPEEPEAAPLCLALNSAGVRIQLRLVAEVVSERNRIVASSQRP